MTTSKQNIFKGLKSAYFDSALFRLKVHRKILDKYSEVGLNMEMSLEASKEKIEWEKMCLHFALKLIDESRYNEARIFGLSQRIAGKIERFIFQDEREKSGWNEDYRKELVWKIVSLYQAYLEHKETPEIDVYEQLKLHEVGFFKQNKTMTLDETFQKWKENGKKYDSPLAWLEGIFKIKIDII